MDTDLVKSSPIKALPKKDKFTCEYCADRSFKNFRTLRQHKKKFHPGDYFSKKEKTEFVCNDCDRKYFKNYKNLKRHVKDFHPTKLSSMIDPKKIPSENLNFGCSRCSKRYRTLEGLKKHEHKKHREVIVIRYTAKCPLCNMWFRPRSINSHIESDHQIKILQDEKSFSHLQDFFTWKKQTEFETTSKFVKKHLPGSSKNAKKYTFRCHRSGYYSPRGNGFRQPKKQGSAKIDAYCPAQMVIHESLTDGSCKVYFTHTHVGHKTELCHFLQPRSKKSKMQDLFEDFSTDMDCGGITEDLSNEGHQEQYFCIEQQRENLTNMFASLLSKLETQHDFQIVKELVLSAEPLLATAKISNIL